MSVSRNTTTPWDATAGDTPFRAWVQAMHDAFSTAGLTQASDTGQINPATVNFPGAEGSAGFEVWRFNDSEQTTDPLFIRVEYWRGDLATELRLTNVQVGKGTNGSGTLTSANTAQNSGSAGAPDSSNRLIHCAYSDSALIFVAYADAASNAPTVIQVERERDAAGLYTGRTHVVLGVGTFAAAHRYDGGWFPIEVEIGLAGGGPDIDGARGVGGMYPQGSGRPLRSTCLMLATDLVRGESGDVDWDGAERAYIADVGPGIFLLGGATPVPRWGTSAPVTDVCRLLLLNE